VRRSGNHLRVAAQLVRADNGYEVWSGVYEREMGDVFKLQDEIIQRIVGSLPGRLRDIEGQRAQAACHTPIAPGMTVHTQAPRLAELRRDLLSLTVSFAAVDWVMSLDPHWGSTIYGLIFLVGQGLSALCFSIILLTIATRYEPYAEVVKPMQFHDIGKLTLAFVMLFAYFSFSQWLIIWSGNLPDEISWYLQRIRGYWGYIILAIVMFHFALPFAMLLSRDLKRAGRRLVPLALLLMFMRLVDIYWYVIPNFKQVTYFSIWYIVAPIGLGGLWLTYFFYNLRQRPLLPAYDPQMPLFLNQKHEH